MFNVASTAVRRSLFIECTPRRFGWLMVVLAFGCAIAAATGNIYKPVASYSAPTDRESTLALKLTSIVLSQSPDLTQQIRFLTLTEPRLRFAAVWHGGQRVHPEQGALMSLRESRALEQVGGRLGHLLALVRSERTPQSATLHSAGQSARARCWRSGQPRAEFGICMLLGSDDILNSATSAERSIWSAAGPALLLFVALLLGLLFFLRGRLLEWIHDARQPLCNIRLQLDLLHRFPERRADCRAVLDAEVGRLDSALQDLARWHHARSWLAGPGSPRTVGLRVSLKALVLRQQSALNAANCTLALDLDSCPSGQVAADELARIVSNVLDNCVRHAPGATVSVACKAPLAADDWILVDFVCTPAATPSQKIGCSTERSGLVNIREPGLQLCRNLARARGWRLRVDDDPHCFVVSLALPPSSRSTPVHSADLT